MNQSVFDHHPILVVEDIILKRVESTDIAALEELCSYRKDPNEYNGSQLLEKVDSSYAEKTAINWGMYVNGELAGTVGFYRGFNDDEGEIGYVIREKFRRMGYTAKSVAFLSEFGLSVMQLKLIKAYTSAENTPSQKVLNKVGFVAVESDIEDSLKYIFKK